MSATSPVVHATWNALAPSDQRDLRYMDQAACDWSVSLYGRRPFDELAFRLLREGARPDRHMPTCLRCAVLVDYRLENPS